MSDEKKTGGRKKAEGGKRTDDEKQADERRTGAGRTGEERTGRKQTDEKRTGEGRGRESKSRRDRMGEGIRQGIGVLSAFKEALEETIQEARDRGDLSADRAKQVMKEALDRAQHAAEDAKEKLDFAHQLDVDALRTELDAVQSRVSALERAVFGPSVAKEDGGDEDGGAESGSR